MSAKFLLALIAVNGLCLSANAATGSPPATTHHITQLSQTIANLIDIDDRHLVELAINRALLAQKVNEVKVPTLPPMVTAGVPRLPTQTDKQSNADYKQPTSDDKEAITPTIGVIAVPQDGSSESTTTDTKQSNVDDKKASPGNIIRVGLINNGGAGSSKSTSNDKQSNAEDKKAIPEHLLPVGLINIHQDGSTKSTTTDSKQPNVRGGVPKLKLPVIGRYLKQKEPSIGQMKTSESENTHNSSTTVDPKTAR